MRRREFLLAALTATTFLASPMTARAEVIAQLNGQSYAMGVNFGIGSYFASGLATVPSMRNLQIIEAAKDAFSMAGSSLAGINAATDAPPDFLPADEVAQITFAYFHWLEKFQGGKICEGCISDGLDFQTQLVHIEGTRDAITAKLSRVSAGLTNAYVLGVNMGIAEGHASGGDQYRQIVGASLQNARAAAVALGLNVSQLDVCIGMVNSSTPMSEIYHKIVPVRTTFQSLM